jgi:hypothetical protein
MKRKRNIKIAFLIGALSMFAMVPGYCFFLMENSNLTWYPVPIFLTCGILSLINYFIMHMEYIRKYEIITDNPVLTKEDTQIFDKVA